MAEPDLEDNLSDSSSSSSDDDMQERGRRRHRNTNRLYESIRLHRLPVGGEQPTAFDYDYADTVQ